MKHLKKFNEEIENRFYHSGAIKTIKDQFPNGGYQPTDKLDTTNPPNIEEKNIDLKQELIYFFNWLDENGIITGNSTPFYDENNNVKSFGDIVDGYLKKEE